MEQKITFTLMFINAEELHNLNIDLIRTLQAASESEINKGCGYHVLNLLEQISDKAFQLADEAMDRISSLQPVAQ